MFVVTRWGRKSTLSLLATISPRITYMSSSRQRGKGRGAARGRNEDPEVQLSKTLSYILRHGAQREGLSMRSDGYVKLEDLVSDFPGFSSIALIPL